MKEWLPSFATVGRAIALEDLILFGDCYYLPHEEGVEAVALCERARDLLARPPADRRGDVTAFREQARRLRDCCARMTELRDRPLFHALSGRVWELREALERLDRYVDQRQAALAEGSPVGAGSSRGTRQGGMVARLQRLLAQRAPSRINRERAPTPWATRFGHLSLTPRACSSAGRRLRWSP